jgi:hypothetical protein
LQGLFLAHGELPHEVQGVFGPALFANGGLQINLSHGEVSLEQGFEGALLCFGGLSTVVTALPKFCLSIQLVASRTANKHYNEKQLLKQDQNPTRRVHGLGSCH